MRHESEPLRAACPGCMGRQAAGSILPRRRHLQRLVRPPGRALSAHYILLYFLILISEKRKRISFYVVLVSDYRTFILERV